MAGTDPLNAGLQQLVDEGTLSPQQAGRTAQVLAAALHSSSAGGHPTGQPDHPHRANVLVEVAAYVGGALMLGGAGIIVGNLWRDIPRGGRIGLTVTVTVFLAVAGLILGLHQGSLKRTDNPSRRRLSSALGALATGSAAAVGGLVVDGRAEPLSIGVAALLVSVPLYVVLRGAPLLFASWLAGMVALWAVCDLIINGTDANAARSDDVLLLVWSLALIGYGTLWLALALLDVVTENEASAFLAAAAGLLGSEVLATQSDYAWVGLVLSVAVGAGIVVAYSRIRHWSLLLAGVLLALIVPATALATIFDNYLAPALALLIIGIALLAIGGSVLIRRSSQHHGAGSPAPAR